MKSFRNAGSQVTFIVVQKLVQMESSFHCHFLITLQQNFFYLNRLCSGDEMRIKLKCYHLKKNISYKNDNATFFLNCNKMRFSEFFHSPNSEIIGEDFSG